MKARWSIETTKDLAAWYNDKFREMGGVWRQSPEDCNRHLDDMGVQADFSKALLDVGCGGGHFIEQAQQRVVCTGIDVSAVALGYALGQTFGRSTLLLNTIERLPILQPALDADRHRIEEPIGPFDYIASIGSIEHIVNLPAALNNIRQLLKPAGRWYFYVPNELWIHQDQPNERTATDDEWAVLFSEHGLVTDFCKRWHDCTAFAGSVRC